MRLLFLVLSFIYCVNISSQSLKDLTFGSDSTLDIITWNLEWFPASSQTTIDSLVVAIKSLNVDVIAIQEINDVNAFNQLIALLQDYSGYYYIGAGGSLRLGFIYKSAINVNNIYSIYNDPSYSYSFAGRPPLVLDVNIFGQQFIIINNHFKCCGDGILNMNDSTDEEFRRYSAIYLIKQYINLNYSHNNIILLGDLNDRLDDNIQNNVFMDFIIDSTNFLFCDLNIANGSSSNWSYPGWPSHLDHILISNELFDEFNDNNSIIRTIRVDSFMSGGFLSYETILSDHLPVGLRLPINQPTSLDNLIRPIKKFLIDIRDLLGKRTSFKYNVPLLYIFNDGTVEKTIVIQ